jgi:hypothetical protein
VTLRYYYRDNDGDIVEITDRIRRGGTDASYQAEEGAVGTWELEVDDPDGTFNVRGYRIVYAQEDEALADDQHGVVWVGYTGERYISRLGTDSPAKRTEDGRTWRIQLHDLNTRLSWRINVGNDCDRPAETDLARIAWLMGTNEMGSWLDDDDTYIDTGDAVDMDEVDYTGQAILDVADDCAQQSGRNYGLLWEYSGDPADPVAIKLWYKFGTDSDYSSTKQIDNRIGVADWPLTSDVLFPSLDATLNRSPSRIAWGVYQLYDGGAVYQTNAVTAERFNKIDVTGRGENIKSAGAAAYRANRYLNTVSDEETDRIEVSVMVAREDVNSILPFHRIQVFFTHLPGYSTDYVWMRVVERTVRDIAWDRYELGLTLMVPAQDSFPDDEGGGDTDATLRAWLLNVSGPYPLPSGPLLWGKTGDQTAAWLTTIGPFDFIATSSPDPVGWESIVVTADGVVSQIQMNASAIGVALGVNEPYTVTFSLLRNGSPLDTQEYVVSVSGASMLWAGSATLSATNVAVSAGDIISASLSCIGADGYHMEGFRSPHGLAPGYLFIKGGIF